MQVKTQVEHTNFQISWHVCMSPSICAHLSHCIWKCQVTFFSWYVFMPPAPLIDAHSKLFKLKLQ